MKGRSLLALLELQPGCREVSLKVVQELRGSAQLWCAARPALGPELPVMQDVRERERDEKEWILAVVEPLASIVLATVGGPARSEELAFYVTDNESVR